MADTYAHMCRDGHVEIGHNDSSDEHCPLCRALADAVMWRDRYEAANQAHDATIKHANSLLDWHQ